MAACVCASARKLIKFYMELTARGNALAFLGELIGRGMMRGNSGDRCPLPGPLTYPSPLFTYRQMY